MLHEVSSHMAEPSKLEPLSRARRLELEREARTKAESVAASKDDTITNLHKEINELQMKASLKA